jgi:hypothetical protein
MPGAGAVHHIKSAARRPPFNRLGYSAPAWLPPSIFLTQWMFADLALRPCGETLAALGEIEPLLGQPQQAALVEGRCGFVCEVDDFGGG